MIPIDRDARRKFCPPCQLPYRSDVQVCAACNGPLERVPDAPEMPEPLKVKLSERFQWQERY